MEQHNDGAEHRLDTDMLQDHDPMLEPSRSDNEKPMRHGQAKHRWSRNATDFWLWETCAMVTSLLSFVAIVLILRLHEGRPLPTWPLSITINSLISVFSTIMGWTLLVPITAGIGQAKWHWFQQYHTLEDVEVYDQATRGPIGALKMLWCIRWRHAASLGALVTVLALAVDPFVQQVAFYPLEQVYSSQNVTMPVLLTAFGSSAGTSFIKGPVYGALYGLGNYTRTPTCPTGNCTWEPYQTLAVCSQCVDITDKISYSESNKSVPSCDPGNQYNPCLMTLPNGLNLGASDKNDLKNGNGNTLIASGALPPISLNNKGYTLVDFSLLAISPNGSTRRSAFECSLYWCVNTYTAVVNNSGFTEYLQSSYYNATATLPVADLSKTYNVDQFNATFYNITPPTGSAQSDPNVNLTWTEHNELRVDNFTQEDFLIAKDDTIQPWLSSLLTFNESIQHDSSSDVVQLFDAELPTISAIFSRVAQYLTVAYSNDDNDVGKDLGRAQAIGASWENQTIVRVRWAWLTLPALLLFMAIIFLGVTILENSRGKIGVWKSSALALLLHGIGAWRGESAKHVVEMEKIAKNIVVKLVDDGERDGGRLIEKEK